MDGFGKLPGDTQAVLGLAVLYVVFSFFDWQQISFVGITVGQSEWDGIGIVAGLLGFALLAWELSRALDAQLTIGGLSKPTTSLLLALLLALLTVITFLSHGTARHWPAWVGLVLSLAIAVVAWGRGRREGVQLPTAKA